MKLLFVSSIVLGAILHLCCSDPISAQSNGPQCYAKFNNGWIDYDCDELPQKANDACYINVDGDWELIDCSSILNKPTAQGAPQGSNVGLKPGCYKWNSGLQKNEKITCSDYGISPDGRCHDVYSGSSYAKECNKKYVAVVVSNPISVESDNQAKPKCYANFAKTAWKEYDCDNIDDLPQKKNDACYMMVDGDYYLIDCENVSNNPTAIGTDQTDVGGNATATNAMPIGLKPGCYEWNSVLKRYKKNSCHLASTPDDGQCYLVDGSNAYGKGCSDRPVVLVVNV